MGDYKKQVEFTDAETGEVFELNMGSLVSDIRDVLISKRRAQMASVLWKDLTEDQQRDEIVGATQMAEDLVEQACDMIATGGRDVIHAKLDNFKIKGGEVTVTAKGLADDGAVLALNHVGTKSLKIIVADAGVFDQKRNPMDAEPDQPAMFGDDDGSDDDDLFQEAVDAVRNEGKASTPFIQRRLAIGYNKAAALIEQMEAAGIITAVDHAGKRSVIEHSDDQGDIAEGMDADLDAMEEPDDLHDQDQGPQEGNPPEQDGSQEAQPADEGGPVNPKRAGYDARVSGDGPDQNPYDGGTPENEDWVTGYNHADGEIESLKQQGYDARADGQGPDRCKFKIGTDANRFWMIGYDRRKEEEREDA